MLHTLQTRICTLKGKTRVSMNVSIIWHPFQKHAVVIQEQIQSCKTAYYISLQKPFSTYIGGFPLKLGSSATHISKNATMFAKGCCIQGGMVFCLCKIILQVMFACLCSFII